MKITGTATLAINQIAFIGADLTVVQTIDRPNLKLLRVCLSNGVTLSIAGDDYTALSANWATDDDLLAFIVSKYNLSVTP